MPARPARPVHLAALLVALAALVAGVLVARPAEAAASAVRISDTAAVYQDAGRPYTVRVPVTCLSSRACSGYVRLEGDSTYWRSFYSIGGGRSEYVEVRISASHPKNPFNPAATGSDARYVVQESGPNRRTTYHPVTTVERIRYGTIRGTFGGAGNAPSDPKVRLQVATTKGTAVQRVARPEGGSFTFDRVPLGANNGPSSSYVVSVEGDVDGQHRSWFWRGADGATLGGTKESREATRIRLTADDPEYAADVRYGQVGGTMGRAGEVTVAAAPFDSVAPGSRSAHGLDVDSCANVHASVRTGATGSYRASFLPTSAAGGDRRYLVSGVDGDGATADRWYGQSESFGSCLHARGYNTYASSTQDLLALDGAVTKSFTMTAATGEVTVDPTWRATAYQSDKVVTLREKVPGEPVLESPVLRTQTAFSGETTFRNVPPGEYWLEVGRETGCAGWVASRYPDNDLYLQGEDRGAERWKTVAGKWAEYQKSYDMGYSPAKTPPRGYKGWMYRQVCKTTGPTISQGGAIGAGTVNTVVVGDTARTLSPTVPKGAWVTGRVTRVGGKSTKELMVTLYSTQGTLVKRQAITDGSGRFKIVGLASGNYRVSVNTDSWRGIGRGFSGVKTKRVYAGKGYSVGTLRFLS